MRMQFRKDVQVLRGIAVLLVVLFHLGIAGFTSGFLGVDVFFVISGYLMAVMYDPSKKAEFFAKRARRLLPAYFATILATLLVAIIVTAPNDFQWVFKQASFAAVFASNISYWMENSYFAKDTFKPLLHLWSLGVEIQFYLLVPVVYWLFQRSRATFALIAGGSALLCFTVVGISPKSIFGVFCQTTCRLRSDGGKPFYFDRTHLTLTGSKMLRPVFDELLIYLDRRERRNHR